MLYILKFFVLPLLVGMAIFLSIIDAKSLNAIYDHIGIELDIVWMTTKNSHQLISDLGHGIIYFTIALISFVCFKKYYRRTMGLIVLLAAANEIFQSFILSRQANWYDFAYSVSGIALALIICIMIQRFGLSANAFEKTNLDNN